MNLIQKCILLNKLSCRPGFLSLCTIDILGLICCMGLACVLWAAEQHPGLYPLDASSSCLSTFNSVNSSISTSAFTVIASIFFPKFYLKNFKANNDCNTGVMNTHTPVKQICLQISSVSPGGYNCPCFKPQMQIFKG